MINPFFEKLQTRLKGDKTYLVNAAKSEIDDKNYRFNAKLVYYDNHADLALLELYTEHLKSSKISGDSMAQLMAGMIHLELSQKEPEGMRYINFHSQSNIKLKTSNFD